MGLFGFKAVEDVVPDNIELLPLLVVAVVLVSKYGASLSSRGSSVSLKSFPGLLPALNGHADDTGV